LSLLSCSRCSIGIRPKFNGSWIRARRSSLNFKGNWTRDVRSRVPECGHGFARYGEEVQMRFQSAWPPHRSLTLVVMGVAADLFRDHAEAGTAVMTPQRVRGNSLAFSDPIRSSVICRRDAALCRVSARTRQQYEIRDFSLCFRLRVWRCLHRSAHDCQVPSCPGGTLKGPLRAPAALRGG
jgi:hypothetical protein